MPRDQDDGDDGDDASASSASSSSSKEEDNNNCGSNSNNKKNKKSSLTGFEVEVNLRTPDLSMEAIRAALTTSLDTTLPDDDDDDDSSMSSAASFNNKKSTSSSDTPPEVLYSDGATPLFKAMEDAQWQQAYEITVKYPNQVETWVHSTGTVETTFSWSLWRRLPLHEACRRQAPAWLVSQLLSVYPAAACLTTQFGELPLHLAVSCGATPEVVNLLVCANFTGIAVTDQSGRTPLQILVASSNDDDILLDLDAHKVVLESLTRAQNTYDHMMTTSTEQLQALRVKHAAGLSALRELHEDDLRLEYQTQECFLGEVERLKQLLQSFKEREEELELKVAAMQQDLQSWRMRTTRLEQDLNQANADKTHKDRQIIALQQELSDKNAEIVSLNNCISQLSSGLKQQCRKQTTHIQKGIVKTEKSLAKMVSAFSSLQFLLKEQGAELQQLLDAHGIDTTTEDDNDPEEEYSQEEKKDNHHHHNNNNNRNGNNRLEHDDSGDDIINDHNHYDREEEEDVHGQAALNSAAAAANLALNRNNNNNNNK